MRSTDLMSGPFGLLLAQQPKGGSSAVSDPNTTDLNKKYRALLDAILGSESVPQRVLLLCYQRIRQIHGLAVQNISVKEADALNRQAMSEFETGEQLALAAAEKIPYQHHELDDDEVERIKAHFGSDGSVSLLTALAFFDVSCRLDLTFTTTET